MTNRPRRRASITPTAHLAEIERRQNLRTERREKSRDEEQSLEDNFDRIETHAKLRGEVVTRTPSKRGERRKPMRRLSGLEWLLAKKRISEEEAAAGQRYGEIIATAASGDFTSVMGERSGGGFGSKSPTEVKLDAVFAKVAADEVIRSALPQDMGQRIVLLLERVCGAGATVREIAQHDRSAAETMESEFRFGLNLLIAYFSRPTPRRAESNRLTNGAKSPDQNTIERECA